jgi:hypothetical protein
VHTVTPILPSCNYCGNPTHKASECNIPSEDLFCDYCGKEGHQESVCFAKFPERKQLRLQRQNLLASSAVLHPKAKAPQPSTQALPTKGNSNKNVKKKEHNADKREVLQAHAIQVQTLQNELESLRAQLANLKGKSSQPASHAQPVQSLGSREGPLRSFYGLPHDAMVGEYVLSTPCNSNFTPEVATSFCPSYVAAQEASVAPKVFATRQVIQIDGLAYGSSPITRARGVRVVMSQSFHPLNMEEERTLLARGGKLLHHKLLGHQILVSQEYMYIRKTHNFPLISLWNTNFKCMKWRKSL